MKDKLLFLLNSAFGYANFRDDQKEIITKVLENQDSLVVLPTGFGKSVCFQLAGLYLEGVTLVICPLISLMKDQVDKLQEKQISATYISGEMTTEQKDFIYQNALKNIYQFIYVSPERLKSKKFLQLLKKLPIKLLVVDEAHCITQWGEEFRLSYSQISDCYQYLNKNCKKVALTATANKETQQNIISCLEFDNPFLYIKSAKRKNLYIDITKVYNHNIKIIYTLRILEKHKYESGIIYTATRKQANDLQQQLQNFGIKTSLYHSQISPIIKKKNQDDFVKNKCRVMIATNAFGMGIDKANIRFIIHYQLPANIENYLQEIGRAGRDGKDSFCYLFASEFDLNIQQEMITKNNNTDSFKNNLELNKKIKNSISKLNNLVKIINDKSCRQKNLLSYFGESTDDCLNCDICDFNFNKVKNFDKKNTIEKNIVRNPIYKFTSSTERQLINKLKNFRDENSGINDMTLCYLAILKPQNEEFLRKIPQIGDGFIDYLTKGGKIQYITKGIYDTTDIKFK